MAQFWDSDYENKRYTIHRYHICYKNKDMYMCNKLTEAILKTLIAKNDLLDLFIGLNKLIILSDDNRQTREVTCQWASNEKLHAKDTCMWEIWCNLGM